ncbi:hypothetical protein B0T24DRAFT_658840 [Lasiosphaeria ovina]|uniref:Uncharacterized protein n=1 Tax=Lasiosphaeria ovina TaxID=92902 RepID=A0AAE0K4H7_9PEZI|nr:hypothetical protein B0T24DRAFT_658840 [Lasiosphaeria ovina]
MADQPRSEIIKDNPIGKGLDAFRASFSSICEGASVSCTPDALEQLGQEDLQNIVLDLLFALGNLPTIRFLRSKTGHSTLRNDLLKLISTISSDDFDFDFDRIKPLLKDRVYNTLYNTSGFANSSEYRKDMDRVLRDKLGTLYVGLPRFHEVFFGRVVSLKIVSEAVFKKYIEGSEPLFSNGWSGWLIDINQDDILS